MNEKLLQYPGYFINGLSIVLYFLLLPILPTNPALKVLAVPGFLLFAAGIGLVASSVASLSKHRGKGLYTLGVYSLVRHPLYLGAMLLFLSFTFLCPHWIMLVMSIVNAAIMYVLIQQDDRQNRVKFGGGYDEYSRLVPKINVITGIWRRIRKHTI